jgi:hypothetical protein
MLHSRRLQIRRGPPGTKDDDSEAPRRLVRPECIPQFVISVFSAVDSVSGRCDVL